MTYLSDIIVGLQYGFEGKTKVGTSLIKNNFYDLCIKVNGGKRNSPIIFNNQEVFLKEIPYSILFNINTLIGNSCVINLLDLLEDIELLKSLNINLNKLYISKNAHIIQYQHNTERKRNGLSIYGLENNPTYRDKYNKNGIQYGQLEYTEIMKYLKGNIIDKIDSNDLIMRSKKILLYQFYSFNLDIDYSDYTTSSSAHCSAGFCCSLVNPQLVNNIYGICSIYDIFINSNKSILESDVLLKINDIETDFCNTTVICNWLNLDKLIENIKINGVNILIITRCDILINLHKYMLYHKHDIIEFKNWKDLTEYIRKEINRIYCINEIVFSYSKINV